MMVSYDTDSYWSWMVQSPKMDLVNHSTNFASITNPCSVALKGDLLDGGDK